MLVKSARTSATILKVDIIKMIMVKFCSSYPSCFGGDDLKNIFFVIFLYLWTVAAMFESGSDHKCVI